MSACNRQALKKKCPGSSDSIMDESGYASFQVSQSLHNSTVEAPFLFERDSETENCQNAPNTTLHCHSPKAFIQPQVQTPCAIDTHCAVAGWRKSLSLPAASSSHRGMVMDAICDSSDECKSPLPNQIHSATKRRKHFQTSHKSPKKSKKNLFLQLAQPKLCRTRYYDGAEHLDIIGMLVNTQPALECIFEQVNAHTLDTMTKVSKRWEQSISKSRRAVERLENHRFKMNLTKENHYVVKRGRTRFKHTSNQVVPLQLSNAISNSMNQLGKFDQTNNGTQNMDIDDEGDRHLVEQAQRIKCPRCGKSSKVFLSEVREKSMNININNSDSNNQFSISALSRTMPLMRTSSVNSERNVNPFKRFFSLDEMHNSQDENMRIEMPYKFGECTGTCCKFRFCVHCNCKPHPGEKCLVTELGTPSKFLNPSENVTPPKRIQKHDSKLNRKNSLKRLCF